MKKLLFFLNRSHLSIGAVMLEYLDHTSHQHSQGNVLAAACPSRQILEHLTSRWGVLVMLVLKDKVLRFSEIRRSIDGISERMLTKTLQNLEKDGMLIRTSYHSVPPHVDYRLTEYGQQASSKIADLVGWLEENLVGILQAKQGAL